MIAFASMYSGKVVYGIQKEKITDVTSRPLSVSLQKLKITQSAPYEDPHSCIHYAMEISNLKEPQVLPNP
jgi:hypothetical protein